MPEEVVAISAYGNGDITKTRFPIDRDNPRGPEQKFTRVKTALLTHPCHWHTVIRVQDQNKRQEISWSLTTARKFLKKSGTDYTVVAGIFAGQIELHIFSVDQIKVPEIFELIRQENIVLEDHGRTVLANEIAKGALNLPSHVRSYRMSGKRVDKLSWIYSGDGKTLLYSSDGSESAYIQEEDPEDRQESFQGDELCKQPAASANTYDKYDAVYDLFYGFLNDVTGWYFVTFTATDGIECSPVEFAHAVRTYMAEFFPWIKFRFTVCRSNGSNSNRWHIHGIASEAVDQHLWAYQHTSGNMADLYCERIYSTQRNCVTYIANHSKRLSQESVDDVLNGDTSLWISDRDRTCLLMLPVPSGSAFKTSDSNPESLTSDNQSQETAMQAEDAPHDESNTTHRRYRFPENKLTVQWHWDYNNAGSSREKHSYCIPSINVFK